MVMKPFEEAGENGITMVQLFRDDYHEFCNRLIMAGLRFSHQEVDTGFKRVDEHMVIVSVGEGCTGYLFGTDGIEVAESDLYDFLSSELYENEIINIFGQYLSGPDTTIRSTAHFRKFEGRIQCSEKRVLMGPDGEVRTLKRRTDLAFENVVTLCAEGAGI